MTHRVVEDPSPDFEKAHNLIGSQDMGAITVECNKFNKRTSVHLTIIKRINVINSIDGDERRFRKENDAFWGSDLCC